MNIPDSVKQIYILHDPGAFYDFSDTLVVRDETDNKIYLAFDSGCSCPLPFENHVFPTDFQEVRSEKEFMDYISTISTKYISLDIEEALKLAKLPK